MIWRRKWLDASSTGMTQLKVSDWLTVTFFYQCHAWTLRHWVNRVIVSAPLKWPWRIWMKSADFTPHWTNPNNVHNSWDVLWLTSYQTRKNTGWACAGNAGNVFPASDLKGNRELAIPACITHVCDHYPLGSPWNMSPASQFLSYEPGAMWCNQVSAAYLKIGHP